MRLSLTRRKRRSSMPSILIARAVPLLQSSVVIDSRTGQAAPHPVRTSDNAAFPYTEETPFIHALDLDRARRAAAAVVRGDRLPHRPGRTAPGTHVGQCGFPLHGGNAVHPCPQS